MVYIHKESMEATIFRPQQPWGPCHPRPETIHKVATKSLSSRLGSTAREQEAVTVTLQTSWGARQVLPFIPRKNEVGWACLHSASELRPCSSLLRLETSSESVWFFFKSLLNLLQYCFCLCFVFFWPRGMWDLISWSRDRTCSPWTGRQSLNHWTDGEFPESSVILKGRNRQPKGH